MAVSMGRIDKGIRCSVVNCGELAIRSISLEKVESAGLQLSESKRGYLCKEHYKEYKKNSKDDRRIEKWRRSI